MRSVGLRTRLECLTPFSRDDIVILARTNSPLLDDAIALRHAQIEQGHNSGD